MNEEIMNSNTEEVTYEEGLTELDSLTSSRLELENSDKVEIYGDDIQRKEMFADWAAYYGEVSNPNNTTINKFFNAKYAPLNEVLNTIRPIMSKHGLAIVQAPYTTNGDPTVKTIVIHRSGGIISFPATVGKSTKNDIQGFGSTVSYLRRFAVNAIAGVMGEIDDDGNSVSEEEKKPKVQKKDAKLTKVLNEILEKAKNLTESGVDKEAVYKIIADNNNGKKNPNSIKDIGVAKKVLELISNLEVKDSE